MSQPQKPLIAQGDRSVPVEVDNLFQGDVRDVFVDLVKPGGENHIAALLHPEAEF
jgi:hypothetical protein